MAAAKAHSKSFIYLLQPPGYDFKGMPAAPGIYSFDPSMAVYPYGNGYVPQAHSV